MANAEDRFVDENKTLRSFSTLILVQCPKCASRAEIKTDFTSYATTLSCVNCGFSKKKEVEKHDLSIKRNCDTCGKPISVFIPNLNHKKQIMKVRCPHCETVRQYKPNFSSYRLLYSALEQGKDPHFGLLLWLQASFREHLVWAYNYEHLVYLKAYIGAKLREQNTHRYHTTMLEKLPKFMQLSKNREALKEVLKKMKSEK